MSNLQFEEKLLDAIWFVHFQLKTTRAVRLIKIVRKFLYDPFASYAENKYIEEGCALVR